MAAGKPTTRFKKRWRRCSPFGRICARKRPSRCFGRENCRCCGRRSWRTWTSSPSVACFKIGGSRGKSSAKNLLKWTELSLISFWNPEHDRCGHQYPLDVRTRGGSRPPATALQIGPTAPHAGDVHGCSSRFRIASQISSRPSCCAKSTTYFRSTSSPRIRRIPVMSRKCFSEPPSR